MTFPRLMILVCLTATIHAQAPANSLSTWPAPSAFAGHRRVLISTFDSPSPHLCQVRNVEPYRLICGGRSATSVYDREQIEAIATSPRGYAAMDGLPKPLAQTGLAVAGIGLFCGVDGGPPCKSPAIIGLGMVATAGVLQFVKQHQRHHLPQLIYRAAPPPPLPDIP